MSQISRCAALLQQFFVVCQVVPSYLFVRAAGHGVLRCYKMFWNVIMLQSARAAWYEVLRWLLWLLWDSLPTKVKLVSNIIWFFNVFKLSDIVDIIIWFVQELYRILSPSLETKTCNSGVNSCAKVTASKLIKIKTKSKLINHSVLLGVYMTSRHILYILH